MSDNDLPLDVALQILRESDPSNGQSIRLIWAAGAIMEQCENADVTIGDLLRCLDHSGLVAEFGTRALYIRTNRDGFGQQWPDDLSSIVFDRPNWEKYLQKTTGVRDDEKRRAKPTES